MTDLPGASDALRELAAQGTRHSYRRGRVLIEEGEAGDTLYIVLSGRVRAYVVHHGSGREFTLGSYGPGEYVGEMSLDGGLRSASVETLEPTTCAVVARGTLRDFIAQRPDFAFELLAKVIRRARAATLTARQLALNDVYGRLRHLLNAESEAQPDGSRWLSGRWTHLALAARLGCSREMVSRLMKDLQTGGYLAMSTQPAGIRVLQGLPERW